MSSRTTKAAQLVEPKEQAEQQAGPPPPPDPAAELKGSAAAEKMLEDADKTPIEPPKPAAAAKPRESKPKTDEELLAARARIKELEALLSAKAVEDAPVETEREKVGEKVTFHHSAQFGVIRFPFRKTQTEFVQDEATGKPRLVTIEHPRDCARFQPHTPTGGGLYSTEDPEEIAYLLGLTNDKSPRFNPSLLVWKREPIFAEVIS